MADVRFAVLGPLEVYRDGERVVVPGGRRRDVLSALLVHARTTVPADVLIDAGWGDGVPADPRAALYTVISRLRNLLGHGAVASGPAGYRLAVPDEAVDAWRFERLREQAAVAGPEHAASLLDEALGLWRGRAYEDIADREVARVEAQRLELLRADAEEERGRVALELGDTAGAVRPLEVLLTRHPYREQAVALLMTALDRSGRSADALARYDEHRRRMADELGLDPSPAVQDLQARILRRDGSSMAPVPVQPPPWVDTSTAVFGRDAELASLVEAAAANRLVTVTGAGGVGKTRLVAQALPALAGRVGLPIVVVELAAVSTGGVEATVTDALGVERGAQARAVLVDRLRAAPALLVLDNGEHLLTEVAVLAGVLTRRCPQARIVLTSRRRLGVATEHVLRLAPLAAPRSEDSPESAISAPAVALLLDRVRRARHDVAPGRDGWAALADIARRLDGLPLALELVASRVAALGPGAVRDALQRDLDGLDGTASGTQLRATVEWSCRLLTGEQRDLLAALTVFASDFDLPAVWAVTGRLPRPHPGAELAELVDSSLVVANPDGATYRLLAVVRRQVDAALNTAGTRQATRRAHAEWIATLADQIARDWTGPDAGAALRQLQRARHDIIAAIRWALSQGEVDVAASITGAVQQCPHWTPPTELADLIVESGERCVGSTATHAAMGIGAAAVALATRGDLDGAARMAHAAADGVASPGERYLVYLALGVAAIYRGDHDESRRHWQAIADLPGLPLALATEAHSSLALLARYAGDLDRAREQASTAVMLAETARSAPVHAFASYAAGEAAVGDPDRGVALLTAAAEEAAATGTTQVSQVARVALLAALVRTGHHDRARQVATPLIPDIRAAGAWPQLWTTLRILAELMSLTGQHHDAALILAAAGSHPSAPPAAGDDVPRYALLGDTLRTRLGTRVFDQIQTAARMSSREEIADRALALLRAAAGTAGSPRHR